MPPKKNNFLQRRNQPELKQTSYITTCKAMSIDTMFALRENVKGVEREVGIQRLMGDKKNHYPMESLLVFQSSLRFPTPIPSQAGRFTSGDVGAQDAIENTFCSFAGITQAEFNSLRFIGQALSSVDPVKINDNLPGGMEFSALEYGLVDLPNTGPRIIEAFDHVLYLTPHDCGFEDPVEAILSKWTDYTAGEEQKMEKTDDEKKALSEEDRQSIKRLRNGNAVSQVKFIQEQQLPRLISLPKHRLDNLLSNPDTKHLGIEVQNRIIGTARSTASPGKIFQMFLHSCHLPQPSQVKF